MTKYSHSYDVILDNMDLNNYRLRPISAIMYLQDTFARYCATKNLAAYDLFSQNLFWVIGEFTVEFVDELPFWSEPIKTEIWISEISKLKIYTDFVIYHDNKVFAKGNTCWFLLDKNSKRPVKTDIIADKFEVVDEFVLGEHKKFDLGQITEKVNEITHKINLTDLDFNNHVNNKSYINIAAAATLEELRKTKVLKKINVKFSRESYFDDILVCSAYRSDVPDSYIYKIEKDDVSICDIKTLWEIKTFKTQINDYNLKVKSEKI